MLCWYMPRVSVNMRCILLPIGFLVRSRSLAATSRRSSFVGIALAVPYVPRLNGLAFGANRL